MSASKTGLEFLKSSINVLFLQIGDSSAQLLLEYEILCGKMFTHWTVDIFLLLGFRAISYVLNLMIRDRF